MFFSIEVYLALIESMEVISFLISGICAIKRLMELCCFKALISISCNSPKRLLRSFVTSLELFLPNCLFKKLLV